MLFGNRFAGLPWSFSNNQNWRKQAADIWSKVQEHAGTSDSKNIFRKVSTKRIRQSEQKSEPATGKHWVHDTTLIPPQLPRPQQGFLGCFSRKGDSYRVRKLLGARVDFVEWMNHIYRHDSHKKVAWFVQRTSTLYYSDTCCLLGYMNIQQSHAIVMFLLNRSKIKVKNSLNKDSD